MVYECQGSVASYPFVIRSVGLGIRTVEELACFMKENPMLVDDEVARYDFCRFVADELKLKELSEKLSRIIKDKKGIEEFAACILEDTGFANPDEIGKVQSAIKLSSSITLAMKMKLRGDYELRQGRMAEAVSLYTGALDIVDEEEERSLAADIYHNAGTAYSRLFYFKLASEYFLKAYTLKDDARDSYEQYLCALRLSMDYDEGSNAFASYAIEKGISADDAANAAQKVKQVMDAADHIYQYAMEEQAAGNDLPDLEEREVPEEGSKVLAAISELKEKYRE